MSLLDGLIHRLRVLARPRSYDRDLDEELGFHLSLEAMQQEHAGRGAHSPHDARDRARRRFGNPTYLKEETRQMSGLSFFDMVTQDLRFAARTLRRAPGFAVAAILTLALGIGANTAIFSAVDAMLLRPLPYRDPARLMEIGVTVPSRHGNPARDDVAWSYLKAKVFRESQHVFSSMGLYTTDRVTLRAAEASREDAEAIDEGYLPTLGVAPSLGRNFLPDEDQPNGTRSIIISDGFWIGRLHADPAILGRTLTIDNEPFAIIGVMPAGFRGLTGRADLWMTIGARRPFQFNPQEAWDHEFNMVARLAPGVSPERARRDAVVLGARANDAFNTGPSEGWGATARLLDRARVDPIVRRSLLILLGAGLFVLLIACANLANLFLVRASARQREIAVRLAIGASRRRLVRQLITESLFVSILGGVVSIAVAALGARMLSALNPKSAFRAQHLGGLGSVNFETIHLDARALAFAVAATLVTGLLFGLVPALHATRPSVTSALKDGTSDARSRSMLLRRLTTRNVLVVAELALAMVLLAGAGVMVRSLGNLLAVNPGFDASNVLTLLFNSTEGVRTRDSMPAFYQTLIERLRGLPGVEDVALASCPPLSGGCNSTLIWFRDRAPVTPGTEPIVGVHWVTPDWFKTLRIPLLSGRVFTNADRLGAPKVALVGASAARKFWHNESPIGRSIGIGQGGFDTATVVGVVGDVRFETIDSLPGDDVYVPYYQSPSSGPMVFIRTSSNPGGLAASSRRTIHDVAADLPIYDIRTLASRAGDATTQARFSALLLALFATAALILATVGIYGVVSFAVAQRTREIGIRIALGADRGAVLRLVVNQGAALAAVGLVLGAFAALLTTRVLRTLLFDVSSTDPLTLGVVTAILALAAVAASWIPARRAARLEPTEALREA